MSGGSLAVLLRRRTREPPTVAGPGKPEATLPNNWLAALEAFENSDFIRENLGADFQDAFSAIKRVEQAEFSAAVTPLEYDSYLVLA